MTSGAPWSFVIINFFNIKHYRTILHPDTWPIGLDFYDPASQDHSFFRLITISGMTRVFGKSLAVALCMIELFVKWIESEVATLAGGYWSLWGKSPAASCYTKNCPLALGIHMSKVLRSGQTWHWNIMSQSLLFYHQAYYYPLTL